MCKVILMNVNFYKNTSKEDGGNRYVEINGVGSIQAIQDQIISELS